MFDLLLGRVKGCGDKDVVLSCAAGEREPVWRRGGQRRQPSEPGGWGNWWCDTRSAGTCARRGQPVTHSRCQNNRRIQRASDTLQLSAGSLYHMSMQHTFPMIPCTSELAMNIHSRQKLILPSPEVPN